MRKKMTTFTAMMVAEGQYRAGPATQRAAWQLLIDTGLAWQLQGWFGRTAAALIEAGVCEPAGRVA